MWWIFYRLIPVVLICKYLILITYVNKLMFSVFSLQSFIQAFYRLFFYIFFSFVYLFYFTINKNEYIYDLFLLAAHLHTFPPPDLNQSDAAQFGQWKSTWVHNTKPRL